MTLLLLGLQIVFISFVIWQVCEPFADAAQWIGKRFHIPGSVRGATLDAVASSSPEFFTSLFFVVAAAITVSQGNADAAQAAKEIGEGYGSSIATCVGSAVYNMLLIPALCAIMISMVRKSKPFINVKDEVVTRDGMWYLGTTLLIAIFLYHGELPWWLGVVLLGLYGVYILQLYLHAKTYRKAKKLEAAQSNGDEDDEFDFTVEENAHAGFLFKKIQFPMNIWSVWIIIACATLVCAGCCYWLVELTLEIAQVLEVPDFFVAVIITAAASSVPDTLLSIGAARRGDDSGAVSNAFGSNIFNICVALSVPLIVCSGLSGWEPVQVLQGGKPIKGLIPMLTMLLGFSVVLLAVMWYKRRLGWMKGLLLCLMYSIFIAYAVYSSLVE